MTATFRIPRGLTRDQLGPIGRVLYGHVLHDVVPVHDGMLVRCADGLEVEIAFGSSGAELKHFRQHVITAEVTMPMHMRFMRGKKLANALIPGQHPDVFLLVASDGHALRFDWRTKQPEPRGVDAYVDVPPAPWTNASAGTV